MNNEQKAQRYNYLMSQFDVLRNKIADIKITQVNLTEEQERNINPKERKQKLEQLITQNTETDNKLYVPEQTYVSSIKQKINNKKYCLSEKEKFILLNTS